MNQNIKGWTGIEAGKEQGHSALPWHVGMKPGPMIYGPKGEQIADMTGEMLDRCELMANGRFICKAVNCHAELVGRLATIKQIAGAFLDDDHLGIDQAVALMKQILAKAKGEL